MARTVAMLGIMAVYYYKRWRFGLTWAVVGLAYSLVAMLVVIPAFRGEPSDTFYTLLLVGRYPVENVMDYDVYSQSSSCEESLQCEHIITLFQLLAPVAFLTTFRFPQLVLAVPTLIYNFLAEWPCTATIYTSLYGPGDTFIHISTVFGLDVSSVS